MSITQPTPDGGASESDPVDRLQAWLDADSGTQEDDNDDAPEGEESPSAKPDDPEDDAPAKESQPQITSAQLAAMLGIDEADIDVDEDGTPTFKAKIDGKEVSAKFADMRKTHQLQGHAENRVREAAAREQAAQARMQEAEQAIQAKFQEQQQSLQQIHAINAIVQEELKGEFQSINWDALWESNPAQARALERRFEARQQRINSVFQQIQGRDAQMRQQSQQMQEANARKAQESEAQRLTELIPEWKDRDIAEKESREIRAWAQKVGYDQSEINNVRAHNVLALRKAWQQDTLQSKRPEVESKVRSAPKLIKPGTTQKGDANTAGLKTLKQLMKSTGRTSSRAAEEYLMRTGKA